MAIGLENVYMWLEGLRLNLLFVYVFQEDLPEVIPIDSFLTIQTTPLLRPPPPPHNFSCNNLGCLSNTQE